jgi:sortase A
MMRRYSRSLGTLLILAGLATLAWAFVVWAWQDPFTNIYTRYEQRGLAQSYERLAAAYQPLDATGASAVSTRRELRAEAKRFRATARRGQGIGRISVPRLGIDMILVNGTDGETLKKGPGRDPRTFMPGEGKLVYIAGHRTTYLAPFSHIDALRKGDVVTLSMPYATLTYRITGHRIVTATDLSVLRTQNFEQLALQACHPRFFATHRYIAYAKLASVQMHGASSAVPASALAAAARS